jgi:hypothetical protein
MDHQSGRNEGMGAYGKLFLALGLSLVVMFPLTMAFVAQWSHFHLNLSNFYMAVAMVAPMGLIMLGVMRGMFPDRRLNAGLVIGFLALFALGLWLGRTEAFVGDAQFLRAMIPTTRAPSSSARRRRSPIRRSSSSAARSSPPSKRKSTS